MKKGTMITLAVFLALALAIAWSTMGAQRAECRVCVAFGGGQNCATARAATESEARRAAQTTACGPLARGMDASIACDNRPPISAECRGRH